MELNINSPAYYTQTFGVNDDVYRMCRELNAWVKEKRYSELINVVGIVPIVAPLEEIEKGLWKETKKCDTSFHVATVSLHIDYEKYCNADIKEKKELIIVNLLKSVKAVSKKGKIDDKSFENDILKFCNTKGLFEGNNLMM